MTDLISRADAIEAVAGLVASEYVVKDGEHGFYTCASVAQNILSALPSAEAEPTMTEEVREALMRLTMCAREECVICKYKDKCNFDFQYEESTKNMNTILDSLMRSKCEVDAKWIPCSERLPSEDGKYLCCWQGKSVETGMFLNGHFRLYGEIKDNLVTAWMPLPEPYRDESEVEE